MTKVLIRVEEDDSRLYFECVEHSGDRDMCMRVSALCNVLVLRCRKRGYDVDVYEPGRVRIEISRADPATCAVVRALSDVFCALEEEYPDKVKVY